VEEILESLRAAGRGAEHFESFDSLVDFVVREARDGDVVILMSSGAFGGAHETILERLRG